MILCNRNADMQEGRIVFLGSELKVINPTKQGSSGGDTNELTNNSFNLSAISAI